MYYIDKENRVFQETENGFVEVSITAKNKVIVTKELESITVTPSDHIEASLDGASRATIDEVMARFNLSEENPIKAKGVKKAPAKKSASKK